MWIDILTAVSLLFVLEGLLPFLSPQAYRRGVAQMLKLHVKYLRLFGLGSMLLGVALLYLVR